MMAKGALLVLHQRLNQHVTGVQYQRERLRVPFGLRNVHCAGRCSTRPTSKEVAVIACWKRIVGSTCGTQRPFAASFSRPLKLTTSASCICFHTSSRRSSESVSSFDSYIETIEMQGVCPTWLRGLGCRRAHRSERLQHRQPQHQPHLTTERTLSPPTTGSRAPRTSRPWTAQYRKRHRPAPVHGHQRLNGLRTRSDPTRAAELSTRRRRQ